VAFLVMELRRGQTVAAKRRSAGPRCRLTEVIELAAQLLDVLRRRRTMRHRHRISTRNLFSVDPDLAHSG